MLGAPPQLWTWLTTHWCPLPTSLVWVWWRALLKAQYPPADAWRARIHAFEAPDRALSPDVVEDFLQEIASPQQLIEIVEALMHERVLLQRDGHRVQEHVLAPVSKEGTWKHQRGRRQSA